MSPRRGQFSRKHGEMCASGGKTGKYEKMHGSVKFIQKKRENLRYNIHAQISRGILTKCVKFGTFVRQSKNLKKDWQGLVQCEQKCYNYCDHF